jgi:seryl-tRNA synthetase
MSNRDGRKQINVELPIESIEALKEEKKRTGQPLWELLDEATRFITDVDDSTEKALQRRVDNLREKETRLENEIEERQNDLEQVRQTRADAEAKLAQLREQRDSIEELYNQIVTTLQNDPKCNILRCKSTLDEIATREYGRPTESNVDEVISDVQAYCEDNDIDIDSHRITTTNTAHTSTQRASDGNDKPFLKSLEGDD